MHLQSDPMSQTMSKLLLEAFIGDDRPSGIVDLGGKDSRADRGVGSGLSGVDEVPDGAEGRGVGGGEEGCKRKKMRREAK